MHEMSFNLVRLRGRGRSQKTIMQIIKKLSSYQDHDFVVNVFAPEDVHLWKEIARDDVPAIATEEEVSNDYGRMLTGELRRSCSFRLGAGLLLFVGDWLVCAVRPRSVKLRPLHIDVCAGIVDADRGVIGSAFSEGEEVTILTKDGFLAPVVKGYEGYSLSMEASIYRSAARMAEIVNLGDYYPLVANRIHSAMVEEMPHRWIHGNTVTPCCLSCEPENRSLEVIMAVKIPYQGEFIPLDTEGFAPPGELWRPSDGDSPTDPKAGRMTFLVNTKTGQCLLYHRGQIVAEGGHNKIQKIIEEKTGVFKFNNKVWQTVTSMSPSLPGLGWIRNAPHA